MNDSRTVTSSKSLAACPRKDERAERLANRCLWSWQIDQCDVAAVWVDVHSNQEALLHRRYGMDPVPRNHPEQVLDGELHMTMTCLCSAMQWHIDFWM